MPGHTLIELLLVLTLMGATTASLAPTARRYRDRGSVVAAREALVGLVSATRAAAMEAGEARLRVDSSTATVLVSGSTLRSVDLTAEFEVELELSAGRSLVELEFDALGLGRLAGQTFRLRRGEAAAELVVSSYGRVRRR